MGAHLICQQCGHGPANLVVGFHFGGAQQDEEEPVARQHISRASHRECFSWEGDHGGVGMLGMVAGQVWGVSATLKCGWGQKTRQQLQCLLPLHGNLTETMGYQDPGWITRVCRNPDWEVWGNRSLGQRRRNPQMEVSVAPFSWECCSQTGCWCVREGEFASSTGSRFDRTLGTWEEAGKRAQSP